MSIAQARAAGKFSAFTLLEIVLAVAILAMMSVAIYRFVVSNVTAVRLSTELNAADAQYAGFLSLLTEQWEELPAGTGALTGEPLKLNDESRDVITWITSAGPGLLTRYAAGEYLVRMQLRPIQKESDVLELGFLRRPLTSAEGDDSAETWVGLIRGVRTLKIEYFDSRLNSWVDRWTDASTLPWLVKVTLGRRDTPAPWEAVVALKRRPIS